MKGIELPVNVLVIVAIGVIVLIGLIVLLGAGLIGANPIFIKLEEVNACGILVNTHKCAANPDQITVSNRTGYNNLQQLCDGFEKPPANSDKAKFCKVNVCGCKETQ